jgi:hypothetical protein
MGKNFVNAVKKSFLNFLIPTSASLLGCIASHRNVERQLAYTRKKVTI